MTAHVLASLTGIEFVNGVNVKGKGFVQVAAVGVDGVNRIRLVGQLSPDECLAHGAAAFEAAAVAAYEARMVAACERVMGNADSGTNLAAALIGVMREAGDQ